jgi:hypothetical protein
VTKKAVEDILRGTKERSQAALQVSTAPRRWRALREWKEGGLSELSLGVGQDRFLGFLRCARKTDLIRKKEYLNARANFTSITRTILSFTHVHMYGLQRERESIESILISVLRGNQEATRNSVCSSCSFESDWS